MALIDYIANDLTKLSQGDMFGYLKLLGSAATRIITTCLAPLSRKNLTQTEDTPLVGGVFYVVAKGG